MELVGLKETFDSELKIAEKTLFHLCVMGEISLVSNFHFITSLCFKCGYDGCYFSFKEDMLFFIDIPITNRMLAQNLLIKYFSSF